jgi:hypothetical protein
VFHLTFSVIHRGIYALLVPVSSIQISCPLLTVRSGIMVLLDHSHRYNFLRVLDSRPCAMRDSVSTVTGGLWQCSAILAEMLSAVSHKLSQTKPRPVFCSLEGFVRHWSFKFFPDQQLLPHSCIDGSLFLFVLSLLRFFSSILFLSCGAP